MEVAVATFSFGNLSASSERHWGPVNAIARPCSCRGSGAGDGEEGRGRVVPEHNAQAPAAAWFTAAPRAALRFELLSFGGLVHVFVVGVERAWELVSRYVHFDDGPIQKVSAPRSCLGAIIQKCTCTRRHAKSPEKPSHKQA